MSTTMKVSEVDFNNYELIGKGRVTTTELTEYAEITSKENETIIIRHKDKELLFRVVKRFDVLFDKYFKKVVLDIELI